MKKKSTLGSNESAKQLAQIYDQQQPQKFQKRKHCKNYLFFLIICIIVQGVVIGITCSKISFNELLTNNQFLAGDIFLVIGLSVFAVLGLALTNLYEANGSLSGLGGTLIVFVLTLQNYLVFSFIWKLIFWSQCSGQNIFSLSLVNTHKRTYLEYFVDDPTFPQCDISLTKALMCSISICLATQSVLARINLLSLIALSIVGSIFYCLQAEIISQMAYFGVFDIGYGFSIFTFAASLSTLIVRVNVSQLYKQLEQKNEIYYSTRAIGLICLSIIFSSFPFLYVSSIYRYSGSIFGVNPSVIYIMFYNIVFGLISGILGCVALSTIIHQKIHIHLFVCSALSGGVAMSFSSHLHRNLAISLGVGFVTGLIQTGLNQLKNRQALKQNPNLTVLSVHKYFVPCVIGGIILSLSSIEPPSQMLPQGEIDSIQGKGGYRFAQLLISMFLGGIGGILVGFVIKLTNFEGEMRENNIFEHEGKDEEIKLK